MQRDSTPSPPIRLAQSQSTFVYLIRQGLRSAARKLPFALIRHEPGTQVCNLLKSNPMRRSCWLRNRNTCSALLCERKNVKATRTYFRTFRDRRGALKGYGGGGN